MYVAKYISCTSSYDETIPSYRFSRFLVIDTKSSDFDIYKASSLTQRMPRFQIGVACRCLQILQMVSYPITHPVCVKWELTKTRVTFNRPSRRSKDCRRSSLIGLNKFGRTTSEQCVFVCCVYRVSSSNSPSTHVANVRMHSRVNVIRRAVSCAVSTQRVEIGREGVVQEFNKLTP